MKRFSINIQIIVAVIFTLLFVTAAFTTLYGQEKKEEITKEHTKYVTLKITEDENGEIKTIDTTMVFEGEEGMKGQNKFIYKFDSDDTKYGDENVMIWMDDKHNVHKMHSGDSMMFIGADSHVMKCDSMMKVMLTVDLEDEDALIEIIEGGDEYFYNYEIDSDIDGDSIHMIIKAHLDDMDVEEIDKIIMKHSGSGGHAVFVTDDGDVKVLDEEITRTIRIKTIGAEGAEIVRDTIIEDGEHKIIIKTNISSDGTEEKTVEVFTLGEDGDTDIERIVTKEITVEVDGDNINVWTTDEGEHYTVVAQTITLEILDPENAEIKELKKAGLKTKKRDLEVDNLKFSPNPSDGKIKLSFTLKEMDDVTINIYDMNGTVVYTETIKDFQGTYSKEIDISDKGTGVFFLQIVQGLYDVIKKIIIQ